jgi:hypothetical protein
VDFFARPSRTAYGRTGWRARLRRLGSERKVHLHCEPLGEALEDIAVVQISADRMKL